MTLKKLIRAKKEIEVEHLSNSSNTLTMYLPTPTHEQRVIQGQSFGEVQLVWIQFSLS